jgi:hypothetical protein
MNDLGTIVLAAGALGTAAFGIVEGFKWTSLGEAGFGKLLDLLGALREPLRVSYGPQFEALLRGEYRGDRQDFIRVLRQGARVGLTPENAPAIAAQLGSVSPNELVDAATAVQQGRELTAAQRNIIGRFELAADTRVDAALTMALSQYAGANRITASLVAIIVAVVVGIYLEANMVLAVVVGIAAIPLAPIAKDVASAIQAATQALRAKV